MHPEIRQPKPGKCPICGMDLIPATSGGKDETGPRELKLTPRAQALAEIRTARVERRKLSAQIRMVGKVAYDERRVKYITAWVAGRIDRLYVNYTGKRVRRGQAMVYLYSPELIAAQTELLEAVKAARAMEGSGLKSIRSTTLATVDAAREKLTVP
jgi:Cu(I)/Ag(I) efflux system membrane fusion protein